MSEPKNPEKPTLDTVLVELISAMSSLNMPEPETCTPFNRRHAYEHIEAAADQLYTLIIEREKEVGRRLRAQLEQIQRNQRNQGIGPFYKEPLEDLVARQAGIQHADHRSAAAPDFEVVDYPDRMGTKPKTEEEWRKNKEAFEKIRELIKNSGVKFMLVQDMRKESEDFWPRPSGDMTFVVKAKKGLEVHSTSEPDFWPEDHARDLELQLPGWEASESVIIELYQLIEEKFKYLPNTKDRKEAAERCALDFLETRLKAGDTRVSYTAPKEKKDG